MRNPATGAVLAYVAQAGVEDAHAAAEAARRSYAAGSWRRATVAERARVLLRLAELIRANAEELARLESSNVGKPIGESRGEIALGADCFQFYAGQIPSFGGRTVPVSAPGASLAHRRWSTTASRRACLSPRIED